MSEAADTAETDIRFTGLTKSIATPWARFWAKMFDLWLAGSMVLALWLGFVFVAVRTPILEPVITAMVSGDATRSTTASTTPNFLWNLVFFFFAVVVDAMILAAFESTLGLKIVGARLEKLDHTRLSFHDCFQRNISLMIFGFWLGFLAFIPLFLNYQKATRGEVMNWDQTAQTRVFNYRGNGWRNTLAAILLLMLVSGHIALMASLSK